MATPRRIVPVATVKESAALPSVHQTAHLTYHGGPLLSAAEVITVFWGATWGHAAQTALVGQLNTFFDTILTSSLIDLLAEYAVPGKHIGHGRRTGSVTITASEPGGGSGHIADHDVQTALKGWIGAGTVPAPTANSLYFIYLPPGVSASLGKDKSCQVFCGYHSNAGNVYYAVEPYVTCAGCTYGTGILDSLTKVSSHELCEAITDPAGDGWHDDKSGNEIGDICNDTVQQLKGYTVQAEWSNTARACLVKPAVARRSAPHAMTAECGSYI